jgi:hypothetical protein
VIIKGFSALGNNNNNNNTTSLTPYTPSGPNILEIVQCCGVALGNPIPIFDLIHMNCNNTDVSFLKKNFLSFDLQVTKLFSISPILR